MDKIIAFFSERGVDLHTMLITAAVLALGLLLTGCIGRFIFGKKSNLAVASSSAIGILFILVVTVVIKSMGVPYEKYLTPLPFVTVTHDSLTIFQLEGTDYTLICSQALSCVILAFLVNLADRWLPKGENIFSWLFFRCLTVLLGMVMHFVAVWLLTTYLPADLMTYAPVILLGILILMILTGALKIVVGLMVSSVNPLIGALYTFFFANAIGKLITRAVLTTGLLMGLVYLLNTLGVSELSIVPTALTAYIPFGVILLGLWYLVGKVF